MIIHMYRLVYGIQKRKDQLITKLAWTLGMIILIT